MDSYIPDEWQPSGAWVERAFLPFLRHFGGRADPEREDDDQSGESETGPEPFDALFLFPVRKVGLVDPGDDAKANHEGAKNRQRRDDEGFLEVMHFEHGLFFAIIVSARLRTESKIQALRPKQKSTAAGLLAAAIALGSAASPTTSSDHPKISCHLGDKGFVGSGAVPVPGIEVGLEALSLNAATDVQVGDRSPVLRPVFETGQEFHGDPAVEGAVGRSGGQVFGVGLGASVQKLYYLPEAHTDFVFAVLAEELGLVGIVCVLGLFVVLVIRIFQIGLRAMRAERPFSAYLAWGIGLWLGIQALVNIGVNLGALPTKGLTLPLISSGGSSLVMVLLAITMVLRIDYECNREALERPRRRQGWSV